MKILHISTYFYPKIGGVERVIYEIARRQAKKNEVFVICSNHEKGYKEEIIDGIYVYRLKRPSFLPRSFSGIIKIGKIIKRISPDFIFVHDWSPFLQSYLWIRKYPNVLLFHDSYVSVLLSLNKKLEARFYKILEGFAVKKAKEVIATTKKSWKRIYLFYKRKAKIIPLGIDLKEYKVCFRKPKNQVIFIGALVPKKNPETFCRAALIAKKKKLGIKFIIIGDGPLRKMLEKKYSSCVTFLGKVNERRKIKEIKDSFALVLPSFNEGFGLVWLEALALGRPIIGTNVGVFPELIEKTHFGFLLNNPLDAYELVDKILKCKKLIKKRNLLRIKKFIKQYSWDNIVKIYDKTITELL